MLLLSLGWWLRSFAQSDDDDDLLPGGPSGRGGMEDMEDLMDYQSFRIGFDDVVMIVLLLLACYVFGKIWKGCSYLIIVLAVIFYYITH